MIVVAFSDNGIAYNKNAFFQYDYGQQLQINGLSLPDGTLFHFASKGDTAVTKISTTANGITTVDVPQSVLLKPGEMNVYIYSTTENSGITVKSIAFNVKAREKPGNYAPPDEPNIIEELQAKLDQIIETGIANYTPDPQDVIDIINDYVPDNLITNNDTATIPGTAWDAVRGKIIRDEVNEIIALLEEKLDDDEYIQDLIDTYVKANLITNNDAATVPGTAWDAVRGKQIRQDLTALNDNLASRSVNVASTYLTNQVNFSRKSNIFRLRIYGTTTGLTANTVYTLCAMPSGYVPGSSWGKMITLTSTGVVGYIALDVPSGNLTLRPYSAVDVATAIYITEMYI